MKATKVVLSCDAVNFTVQGGSNFESVDKILIVSIPMKAVEQYFPVMLLISLYKVALTLRLWMKF